MSDETRERDFLAKSRTLLDASVEAIDPALRARLRSARSAALASTHQRARVRWVPVAGLLAAAAAAAIVIGVWRADAPRRSEPPLDASRAPIAAHTVEPIPLAAADDIDLFLDLDFFVWLAEQPDAG